MRVLSLLTNSGILFLLQQAISIWFLYDFFLARDSLTADKLWKSSSFRTESDIFDRVGSLASFIKKKHCPDKVLSEPSFDKVILIVIDALGSEFIPALNIYNDEASQQADGASSNNNQTRAGDRMPFVEKLLRQKKAVGCVAHAATPTVTMPRIKALVSGTIPSYVDILYNLATDVSKFEEENILSIAKAQNKTLVFYGDDTWLSLFDKSLFTRSEITISRFATDYITVDTNVTERALPETQMSQIDWDLLILHYLGLDHIGHTSGSNTGPLIKDKLIEMDTVIERIYMNMASRDKEKTLIIVCGDHGMNKVGNHGGGTKLETETAMLFIPINHPLEITMTNSSQIRLNQIDLAPTLSLLMGLKLPKSSKGVAAEMLLSRLWSEEIYKLPCAGFENVLELMNLTDPWEFSVSTEILDLTKLLDDHYNLNGSFEQISLRYFDLASKIQNRLLQTTATNSNPTLMVIILTFVIFLTLVSLRKTSIRLLMPVISKNEQVMCLLTMAIPIFMHGSTSFIENEQLFWPFYSLLTFILFVLISMNARQFNKQSLDKLRVALFVITFLITISWNHFKLFRNGSEFLLPLLSVIIHFNSIRYISDVRVPFKKPFAFSVAFLIMLTKHIEESASYTGIEITLYRTYTQRLAIVMIVLHTTINVFSQPPSDKLNHGSSLLICKLASGWLSLTFLLSRNYNFAFLISNMIMESSLNTIANTLNLSQVTRALLYANFAQSAFYNQGNSNLLSSIDVKPAFFGQNDYSVYLAFPLVTMATYSLQIYWYMKMFQRIQEVAKSSQTVENTLSSNIETVKLIGDFAANRNFLSLGYYIYVCIVLRDHLFVWSVISPKLIYLVVSNSILLFVILITSRLNRFKHLWQSFEMTNVKQQIN